jgi:hypothetical protein
MIQDEIVSFSNGTSLPEVRKQGLSTALRRFALQHAQANGARFGSSYLMSEGLHLAYVRSLVIRQNGAFTPLSLLLNWQ